MGPKAKTVGESKTILSDLMSPPDANIRGSVFGGRILQMVDKAAGVCAERHSGKACVTVAMERVEFLVPIRIGDFVTVEAQVNYVGKTSMEIGVEVYAEDPMVGRRSRSNACLVTMVALNERGSPSSVPPLRLETSEEKARHASALERRKKRGFKTSA